MIKSIGQFILIVLMPIGLYSQDSLRFQDLDEVNIEKTRLFKRQNLYDYSEKDMSASILGFSQLTIFDNQMSDEVWSSKDQKCVDLTLETDSADSYIGLKWNKDQEGCDWVGIGFGWDFWSSKDMGQIVDVSAIEIEIRSKGKEMTNLPWAFGLEDYAGGQAWTGFSKSFTPNGIITNEWTKVTIPMSLFPFMDFDCDPSNIKQLLIQLFAQDQVQINSIRIVPFKGKLKNEMQSSFIEKQKIILDGDLTEWTNEFTEIDEGYSFSVMNTNDSLYIGLKITDSSPRINNQTDGDLWSGDAIEIAFSTNPNADPKRGLFLLSDYHLGINCGKSPYMWNFSDSQPFENGKFAIMNTSDGYQVEIGIALSEFTKTSIKANQSYGLEVAVDAGDNSNKRNEQVRWNSENREGFHKNPSLWGTLIIN